MLPVRPTVYQLVSPTCLRCQVPLSQTTASDCGFAPMAWHSRASSYRPRNPSKARFCVVSASRVCVLSPLSADGLSRIRGDGASLSVSGAVKASLDRDAAVALMCAQSCRKPSSPYSASRYAAIAVCASYRFDSRRYQSASSWPDT